MGVSINTGCNPLLGKRQLATFRQSALWKPDFSNGQKINV